MKTVTEEGLRRKTARGTRGAKAKSTSMRVCATSNRRSASSGNRRDSSCLVTTYENRETTNQVMRFTETREIDPDDVDYFRNEITCLNRIRQSDGSTIEYRREIEGLGRVSLPLLFDLMWAPGQFHSGARLARNSCLGTLRDRNVMAVRFRGLRKAFGDTARKQFYFVTRRIPYSIGWNQARSWRIIERLPEPRGDSHPRIAA